MHTPHPYISELDLAGSSGHCVTLWCIRLGSSREATCVAKVVGLLSTQGRSADSERKRLLQLRIDQLEKTSMVTHHHRNLKAR